MVLCATGDMGPGIHHVVLDGYAPRCITRARLLQPSGSVVRGLRVRDMLVGYAWSVDCGIEFLGWVKRVIGSRGKPGVSPTGSPDSFSTRPGYTSTSLPWSRGASRVIAGRYGVGLRRLWERCSWDNPRRGCAGRVRDRPVLRGTGDCGEARVKDTAVRSYGPTFRGVLFRELRPNGVLRSTSMIQRRSIAHW